MTGDLPDALVLGAGGTLGEAWLRGVLGGLEAGAGLDFRDCEYLLGTSAGSIVAATLAAGKRPEAGEGAAREWAHAAALPEAAGEPGFPQGGGSRALGGRRPWRGALRPRGRDARSPRSRWPPPRPPAGSRERPC